MPSKPALIHRTGANKSSGFLSRMVKVARDIFNEGQPMGIQMVVCVTQAFIGIALLVFVIIARVV